MEISILFRLDPANEKGYKTESVWAECLEEPYHFRVLNSPFYIFGISAEDTISAKDIEGTLEFQEVVSRGGHSTYRVFLQGGRTISNADFQEQWEPIAALGATFENANDRFIAVDVPPGKDIENIRRLLDKGEQIGVWAYEEGNREG